MIINRSLKHTDGVIPAKIETKSIPETDLIIPLAVSSYPMVRYGPYLVGINKNAMDDYELFLPRSPEPSGTVVTLIQE